MTLETFFHHNPRIALAFSGGVDSAYLLYAARMAGIDIQPYYAKTAFQPQFETDDALRLCAELKLPLKIISLDILADSQICSNPSDRCYYCKRTIFEAIAAQASKDRYPVLIDGTNASDDAGDRPGMRALQELKVRSPLRECGLTKAEIRARSKEAGLFTWDKPAYACLATRIPTGDIIDPVTLSNIEQAENFLFSLGYRDFRVRVFHNAAKIQLQKEQMPQAASQATLIYEQLLPLFSEVLLDLKGR